MCVIPQKWRITLQQHTTADLRCFLDKKNVCLEQSQSYSVTAVAMGHTIFKVFQGYLIAGNSGFRNWSIVATLEKKHWDLPTVFNKSRVGGCERRKVEMGSAEEMNCAESRVSFRKPTATLPHIPHAIWDSVFVPIEENLANLPAGNQTLLAGIHPLQNAGCSINNI